MAIKDWVSVYPTGGIDTNVEQPDIILFVDNHRVSQILALRNANQALQSKVGSDFYESGSLRYAVWQLEGSQSFLALPDTPSDYTGFDGQFIKVSGSSLVFTASTDILRDSFLSLNDTPTSYSGVDGYLLKVTGSSIAFTSSAGLGGGGSGGGFDREEFFTSSFVGQQTFTIATAAAVNANNPSGYSVRVYVNGLKHKFSGSASTREFDIVSSTQIKVGGLNINDDIEIVYGV